MAQIESFYLDLGRLLSAARTKAGLSQEQLGARLHPPMRRASIANMETGKQRVLAKTLVDLAAALEIEISALIPRRAPARRTARRPNIRAELQAALDLPADKLKKLAKQLEHRGDGA
jgi:transcriptional regulator with XRE-family HTH domain